MKKIKIRYIILALLAAFALYVVYTVNRVNDKNKDYAFRGCASNISVRVEGGWQLFGRLLSREKERYCQCIENKDVTCFKPNFYIYTDGKGLFKKEEAVPLKPKSYIKIAENPVREVRYYIENSPGRKKAFYYMHPIISPEYKRDEKFGLGYYPKNQSREWAFDTKVIGVSENWYSPDYKASETLPEVHRGIKYRCPGNAAYLTCKVQYMLYKDLVVHVVMERLLMEDWKYIMEQINNEIKVNYPNWQAGDIRYKGLID